MVRSWLQVNAEVTAKVPDADVKVMGGAEV